MRGGRNMLRLLIGAGIILFGVIKFCSSAEENPYTGETQYVDLSAEEEMALGAQSTPVMLNEYGGLHRDESAQTLVRQTGQRLVQSSVAASAPYDFKFFLLSDESTINAFALPGGPVFITYGLFARLQTEDQLAGVIAHEIGHVIGRHSAQQMAQQGFTNTLLTGVAVGSESHGATQAAAVLANLVNMKYGRGDELESDYLGVKIMMDAGYDPEALIGVMEILAEASGPNRVPEFQSTHPDPENRIQKIREAIEAAR
ncbi:M48 family metalloprotease [Gramella sp. GC03-9]|uniref:M48 family metalloprotease n=1 Tax=Christiangramia oceanisediminis TaxID=2920386 RepID=A0A9X2I205_9FLAO|nr:M48 family metalloprotease [Gramella oceanisediminis]MCP9198430.1 M48 family metalloprotease [Gramella oceanisediminis]